MERVRTLSIISELRNRLTNPNIEQDCREMSSRYLVLWIKTTDMFVIVFRDRISTFLSRLREKIFLRSKLNRRLIPASRVYVVSCFFLPEDNILEDLLLVDRRVHYAAILNVSSVREDYVSHDSRGEERSAFVFYTIKCIVFFLVLFWEVSATLCRKSSVELTLQKTITPNTSDSSPKSLDEWSSSQINRTTSFWRSIGVIRSLVLLHCLHWKNFLFSFRI